MMKKASFFMPFVAASALIIVGGCSMMQQKVYPYPFDTAQLEFEVTGNVSGTNSISIKGDRSVSEFHGTRKDGSPADAILINTGAMLHQIDLNAKIGTTSKNPIYEKLKNKPADKKMDYLMKLAVGATTTDEDSSAEEKAMPAAKGEKEVAGQKCALYDLLDIGEICLWNGIPIYSNISVPDAGISNISTAVKIATNVDVPDSKFNLPEGVQLQDATEQ